MRTQDPTTTALAILGLLSIRSMSGYELTAFAAMSIGHFWPMHRSLVYRELVRLEDAGYVSGTDVPQERVPDKRTYAVTPAGHRVLEAWLATPGFEPARYRNEFLVKFFFASHMGPDELRRVLDDYRTALERELADLRAIVEKTETIPGSLFGRLAALHGVRTREALLDWIDEVEDVLRQGVGASWRGEGMP
jgi:PadR family transcriptional regulator, regulatory protein AphA